MRECARRSLGPAAVLLTLALLPSCGGDPTDGYAGTPAAEELLDALFVTIVEHPGCTPTHQLEELRAQIGQVEPASARVPLTDAAAALDEAAAACEIDEDVRLDSYSAAMGHLAAAEREMGGPGPAAGTEGLDWRDPTLAGPVATSQFDRFYRLLSGQPPVQQSRFWLMPSELGHVLELRALAVADASPTTLITGSSHMANGIEVSAVRNAGIDAFNLALPSATPYLQPALVEQAETIGGGPVDTVVWGVSPQWVLEGCGPDPRYEEILDHRSRIGIGDHTGSVPTLDLLLGDDPSDVRRDVPGYDDDMAYDGTRRYGAIGRLQGKNNVRRFDQAKRYVTIFERRDPLCTDKLDVFHEIVRTWVDGGREVIVIVPPIPDDLRELHPDPSTHAEITNRLEARAVEAGGSFVDLTRLIADHDFHDLTHVDLTGSVLFTEALIAELSG